MKDVIGKNKNIKISTTMNQEGKTEPQSKRRKKEKEKKKSKEEQYSPWSVIEPELPIEQPFRLKSPAKFWSICPQDLFSLRYTWLPGEI